MSQLNQLTAISRITKVAQRKSTRHSILKNTQADLKTHMLHTFLFFKSSH